MYYEGKESQRTFYKKGKKEKDMHSPKSIIYTTVDRTIVKGQ